MINNELKTASDNYMKGYTCSQAVISAFADKMGLDQEIAYCLFEGFGGGFGGKQEVCGAFSAAVAVISYYASTGSMDGKSKGSTECNCVVGGVPAVKIKNLEDDIE